MFRALRLCVVNSILRHLALATSFAIALLWLSACPHQPVPRGGCDTDVQCKGQRVCVKHACVNPPETPSGQDIPESKNQVKPVAGPPPFAMFGGNAKHTGQRAGAAPLKAPTELWRVKVGKPIAGSPTVGPDGTVFFVSHDGNVYAITSSGTQKWKFSTEDRVWTTPAVAQDGTVYIGSDDDHLYALDGATGKEKWRFRAGNCDTKAFGPEGARCDVDSSPTIAQDGTIYIGGDAVYAVWPNGKLRWKFATPEHVRSSIALGDDGTAYATCLDDALYAIRPDGTKAWEYRTRRDIESSVTLGPDGTIWFGGDDNAVYALNQDGSLKWKVITGNDVRSTPALRADGSLVIGSYDGRLYAIDSNGSVLWRFAAADKIHSTPAIASNGVVMFGSQDNHLYAVDSGGKLLWFLPFDGDVDTTPAISADGTIYATSDDGTLRAFR